MAINRMVAMANTRAEWVQNKYYWRYSYGVVDILSPGLVTALKSVWRPSWSINAPFIQCQTAKVYIIELLDSDFDDYI